MTQQMVCPDCMRPALRPDARFCGKCGALLTAKVRSWRKLKRAGQGILMTCGVAFVIGATIFIIGNWKLLGHEPITASSPASSPGTPLAVSPKPTAPPVSSIMSQATTLEIAGASPGFGGNWGGYSNGMLFTPSGIPVQATDTAPEAISFDLRNGTVVIEFTVSGGPDSSVVGTPKAWAPSPDEVVLRLETETFQYHRVKISHYKLLESERISYAGDDTTYDAHSGDLLATEKDQATFKKLEGEAAEEWDRARAEWEEKNHTVNLGSFESPAEKEANE